MAQYQSFPGAAGDSRTLDKLKALRQNVLSSLILLNDLRTLRRLLLGERRSPGEGS